ncbi:MAG: DUF333 domain-containing protein [Desulfamplus sp.]
MIKNYLVILAIVLSVISCKTNNVTSYNVASSSSSSSAATASTADNDGAIEPSLNRIANPAAARCINDGYKLEPVIKNGVTVEYMCVDPNTGVKWEVWKYFRKECSLKN